MRILRRTPSVESPDAGRFRLASIRTRALRVVLAAGALVLLGLAAWSTRGLDPGRPGLLPGSSGVVVIDLSLSISDDDYEAIRSTVNQLIDDRSSVGLEIFSDVGYELLPPGTPATELRPILRFLKHGSSGSGVNPSPVNPWSGSFRAGTRISSALELARDMLVRDGVTNGSVLLLSDLITAPEDVPQLVRVLQQLRRESIAVRVVPLSPLRDGRTIFEGLLGKGALVAPSEIEDPQPVWSGTRAGVDTGLLVFGALLLAVLAAHEHFAGRLGLPYPRGRHA
jgi:hypothetical protein